MLPVFGSPLYSTNSLYNEYYFLAILSLVSNTKSYKVKIGPKLNKLLSCQPTPQFSNLSVRIDHGVNVTVFLSSQALLVAARLSSPSPCPSTPTPTSSSTWDAASAGTRCPKYFETSPSSPSKLTASPSQS